MKGRRIVSRVAVLSAAGLVAVTLSAWAFPAHGARVLLVGSFKGKPGHFTTIQSAVNQARPGDWILVGPGDYHESADASGPQGNPAAGQMGGVYITTPGIHLRGMDRSMVIVDGTKSGSSPCSGDPAAQNYGPVVGGSAVGRNGIVVSKANHVSVENLTVCNFLAGSGASGNQVWWNGGADSGQVGLHGYTGRYLTATSTFFSTEATASQYGIFAGNAAGPGTWDQLYANNMNDSGMYVGACRQVCDVTINRAWMEYNALGYSGTNSGGAVVIKNSEFDHNQDGLDTNTQVNGDAPAPQNGACPDGGISPITHTRSCWVFTHNYVHDNNNPNAPASGGAANGPVGTGMTLSGGRNDTVVDNVFANNGAWGALYIPFADSNPPSNGQTCTGAGGHEVPGFGCVLDPEGNALLGNTFSNNGFFANPSNSDFGQITLFGGEPQNCYRNNLAPNGSAPRNLQQTQRRCGPITAASNTGGKLFPEVLCDTGLGPCPPGSNYPQRTGVHLRPVPTVLPTMVNPCRDVPGNAWCPSGSPRPAPSGMLAIGAFGLLAGAPRRETGVSRGAARRRRRP